MDKINLTPKSYICKSCEKGFVTPQHCGRPMILELTDDKPMWICWKGDHPPCCGRPAMETYTPCCESTDLKAAIDLDDSKVLL